MKKKTVCTKCGHKHFTLISQKHRDILICKRCGDTTIYPKEPITNKCGVVKSFTNMVKFTTKLIFYLIFGVGVLALMDVANIINVF